MLSAARRFILSKEPIQSTVSLMACQQLGHQQHHNAVNVYSYHASRQRAG